MAIHCLSDRTIKMKKVVTFTSIILWVVLSSCSFDPPGPFGDCEGGPTVVNSFPDTLNFVLRDEPYVLELENSENPVFEHTGGSHISFSATSLDREIVNATINAGNTLRIVTLSAGIAEVSVTALDDCEFGSGDTFIAKVTTVQ